MYKTVDGRVELKEIGPRFELFCMLVFYVELNMIGMVTSNVN